MKKALSLLLVLVMALALFGCGEKKAAAAWSINVEGANAKEFTSVDYDKLDSVEIDAVLKKKDGSQLEQKWTGVPLAKVLEAMGVKEYTAVVVEAKDGYGKEYTSDLVKSADTILAIKVDGKALEGDAAPVELVAASQSGNMWIKSVAKIKIVK